MKRQQQLVCRKRWGTTSCIPRSCRVSRTLGADEGKVASFDLAHPAPNLGPFSGTPTSNLSTFPANILPPLII